MISSISPYTVDYLDLETIPTQELLYTPASSQLSQYDSVFDCSASSAISEAGFSSYSSEPLSPERPCGLGLYLPSFDEEECYPGQQQQHWHTPQDQALQVTSSPSLITTGLPIVDPQFLTNDLSIEPTSLPSTPWTGLQPTLRGPSRFQSPACSNYSIMSSHSRMPSPFPQFETGVRLSASPFIKVEPPVDELPDSLDHHSVVEQSPPVDPRNLYNQMPESIEERVVRYLTPSERAETMEEGAGTDYRHEYQTRLRALSANDAQLRSPAVRKKRRYTTEENARLSCPVCGKLFQRKFNQRKHMETHQRHRPQPFACEYEGCNRRFGRRTDLNRHEKSLHLQLRDHTCSLCDASFARKDTLRRHVDDGCRKRLTVKQRPLKVERTSNSPDSRPAEVPPFISLLKYRPQ